MTFAVTAAPCPAARLCPYFDAPMNERIRVMQRQPRRISITLSHQVHDALLTRSEEEGRSLSNLCAFLLEEALRDASRLMIETRPPASRTTIGMGDGHLDGRREGPNELWRQRH